MFGMEGVRMANTCSIGCHKRMHGTERLLTTKANTCETWGNISTTILQIWRGVEKVTVHSVM